MGRLLVMLFVVLLLAGGGVGTWWYGVEGNPIPGLSDSGNDKGGNRGNFANLPSEFVEMEPLSVPVMEEGRVTKLRTLVVSLEVAGNRGLQTVSANRARLRDAMLSELHALYAMRFVRESDKQMTVVKRRLEKRARTVLGDKMRGIYVQAIQDRKVNQNS